MNRHSAVKDIEYKYKNRYFKEESDHLELVNSGYLIKKLPEPKILDEVLNEFQNKVLPMFEGKLPDRLINTGTVRIEGLRALQNELLKKYIIPELEKIFDTSVCSVNPGVFLLKPPSKNSMLKVHQDASIIDETKEYGLYAWIALQDTTIENGTLHVVPGSHLLANNRRSLNVPWIFESQAAIFQQLLKPLYVKKGEVVFYDNALVHFSPANQSDKLRIAISSVVLPKDFKLIHHFVDEKTPKGKVEAYEVNEDFWIKEDIFSRPNKSHPFLGYFHAYKPPFLNFVLKRKLKKMVDYAEQFKSGY